MQNPSIFSFQFVFFDLTFLEKTKQSIYNFISLVLRKINLIIVIKELLDSLNLFEAQTFCIDELIEVVIVYKYQNFVFVTF